ncbi:MAG: pyridoxamine 5'-phosphate oxidase family protein [Desulfobacteraceae bacterium]
MNMNTEIQEVLGSRIIYLATASRNGIPNVVPIGGKKVIDDRTLLIVDVLLNKTKRNILENPLVAIIAEDLKREKPVSCQLKGTARLYTDGDYFQEAVAISENAWARGRKGGPPKKYKVRSAVLVTIDEIYSNMQGGRKVSESNPWGFRIM